MGSENDDYKPMQRAQVIQGNTLSITQAVQAAVASLRDSFREVLGSEPIVEASSTDNRSGDFTIATYGAGKYAQVSRFSLRELPGCCGILVFYHASVATDFQNKGLGSLLLRVREEAARKAGYSVAMATVLKDNKTETKILADAGWKQLVFPVPNTKNTVESASFKNRRTGNEVHQFQKNLF